jgi:hypothetical protein
MCDCEQFMKHLNYVHAYALQYPEHIRLMAKGTKDKQGRNTSKKRRSRYCMRIHRKLQQAKICLYCILIYSF